MSLRLCPHCAEEIKEAANKCKHCGEWLGDSASGKEKTSTNGCIPGCVILIAFPILLLMMVVNLSKKPSNRASPSQYAAMSESEREEYLQGIRDETRRKMGRENAARSRSIPRTQQPAERSASVRRRQIECTTGTPTRGRLYPVRSEVPFLTSPSRSASAVVNQKATAALGRSMHRQLGTSMVLEARCETAGWFQGRIVRADGNRVSWETGWVEKKYVKGEATPSQQAGVLWDVQADSDVPMRDKNRVLAAAKRVVQENPRCSTVIHGGPSQDQPGKYFITCNPSGGGLAFNVFVTP